jgi:hypothetical protein
MFGIDTVTLYGRNLLNEWLIPNLAILLIATASAFYLLPKLAPEVLITSTFIVLAVAIYVHYSQFGRSEYELSTWYYKLRDYSMYVVILVIALFAYMFYLINNWDKAPQAVKDLVPEKVVNMVASPAPGPFSGGVYSGGFDTIARTVGSRIDQLMRKGRIQN